MQTGAEGQRLVALTIEVEGAGLLEALRVAVGRPDRDVHVGPGGNDRAVELDVLGRDLADDPGAGVQPARLDDGGRDQRRILDEPAQTARSRNSVHTTRPVWCVVLTELASSIAVASLRSSSAVVFLRPLDESGKTACRRPVRPAACARSGRQGNRTIRRTPRGSDSVRLGSLCSSASVRADRLATIGASSAGAPARWQYTRAGIRRSTAAWKSTGPAASSPGSMSSTMSRRTARMSVDGGRTHEARQRGSQPQVTRAFGHDQALAHGSRGRARR